MTVNIGILVNQLQYSDGVSNHILNILEGFRKYHPEIKFTIFTGSFTAVDMFSDYTDSIVVLRGFSHLHRTPINYFGNVLRLAREVKARGISILHAHTHYHANIAADVKRFVNIRTVQTNHGIVQKQGILPLLRADHYIAVNGHIIDFLKTERGVPDGRISLVRSGNLLSEKSTDLSKKNGKTFIAAGRMIYEKGFDMYVRAAASLNTTIKAGCRFLLAGEGDDLSDFLALNNELNAGVEYLGNLRDMHSVLAGTDILVNPSRSKSEGFPATIIEAAMLRNLIITSGFSGLTYDFDPLVDGYSFDIDNQKQLNRLLIHVLTNSQEAETRRARFYNKAGELFSVRNMADSINEIYMGLIQLK